jgi:hypothetical protein
MVYPVCVLTDVDHLVVGQLKVIATTCAFLVYNLRDSLHHVL